VTAPALLGAEPLPLATPHARSDRAPIEDFLRIARADRATMIAEMPPAEALVLLTSWRLWARPKQLAPPGNWQVWLNMSGRGYGKTRTGAEWCHEQAEHNPIGRGCLIGATAGDARDIMIEGESGLLATARPNFRPRYNPSRRQIEWPNGALAKIFTAEEPERLRGPQHGWGWGDEWCAFKYPQEAWDQAMFGLRLGARPQLCVTTTPKPIKLLVDLLAEAIPCWELRHAPEGSEILARAIPTVVTTGSSYENVANLSESWYNRTIKPYEGTRLGDQEIWAKLLKDVEGALWTMALIELDRIKLADTAKVPEMRRIVVSCDPAVTMKKNSNETGIVVAGKGVNGHAYIFADASGKHSPDAWAKKLVELFDRHKADRVIAEVNQGGDLVESTLRTVDAIRRVPYRGVHATRGKVTRAEPVAALYEQHKVHHVGTFGLLESQMTTWVPDSALASPDRMDALVWAITDLMLKGQGVYVA